MIYHHLRGKTLGMLFRKASTRTRVSFERRNCEIIQDTERILFRYVNGIMIRTYSHKEVEMPEAGFVEKKRGY